MSWQDYQRDVAAFFTSLGLDAQTDVTLQGVRTAHDVDVVVRLRHVGFEALWLVECKQWKTKVSKLHVLALREIVQDLGADRGLLMAEAGFQSGALEAARLTNVQLTSLKDLSVTASEDVLRMELSELSERVDRCRGRYWAISKADRIEVGLRPDVPDFGYSGQLVIEGLSLSLSEGLQSHFPIRRDSLVGHTWAMASYEADDAAQLVTVVRPVIEDLEARLDRAEEALQR